METSSSSEAQELQKAMHFLKSVAIRSEAYLKGNAWVRAALADLQIDLYLETENGEVEGNTQVEWIRSQIEIYRSVLKKTVFDPDPLELGGSLAIEAAAADLGQYVLQTVARHEVDYKRMVSGAQALLAEDEARIMASECMNRVSIYRGIVQQDILEVIARATQLISCL